MKKTLCAIAALSVSLALHAEPAAVPVPSIAYLYPAGIRRGTTAEILVAGQNLKGASIVLIGGSGITATVTNYQAGNGPLNKIQEEALKEYLKARGAALKNKKTPVPAVPDLPDLPPLRGLAGKNDEELRAIHTLYLDNAKKAAAPMAELVTVTISVSADTPEGNREFRLATAQGLTAPVLFQIGHISEVRENGPWEIPDTGHKRADSVPAVLNGQIMPGETDVWDVRLKKGESLVVACQARNLIPYLADAVPGWFQPVLSVTDEKGAELAWNDDNGGDPDPVLAFTAPADGIYSFVLRDAIYRGRYDFVYRLVLASRIEIVRQLPAPSLIGVPLPGEKPPLFPVDAVSGVIGYPGQTDTYEISAQAGEKLKISVRARRDGSPLDASIRLLDQNGSVVAANDDFEDKTLGLQIHHADPLLIATPGKTETYRVEITDASNAGGEDRFYRLYAGAPVPDFAVLTLSSTVNVPKGGSKNLAVQVIRKDQWQGDVEIRLESSPTGFTAKPVLIPAGQDTGTLVLAASDAATIGPGEIRLSARAEIGGATLVREVLPADLRMQAFGNTHLVQAGSLRSFVLKKKGKN